MKSKRSCRVAFLPDGKTGLVDQGTTLLEASRKLGVAVESVCGGKTSCGKCMLLIEAGERSNLSPVTGEELEIIGRDEINRGARLACVARVRGSVVATVPHREAQLVRKEAGKLEVEIAPAVRNYFVEVAGPERLLEALAEKHGLKDLEVDPLVLRELPETMEKGNYKVTVSVWHGGEIIRVAAGERKGAFGLAVDIGTTTLAGYLTDLGTGELAAMASAMNPQVAFGEDVMSRITYGMVHEDGVERMRSALMEELNRIEKSAVKDAGIKIDDILDVVVVGNTCMHHLFLGIDPGPLGVAPFSPAVLNSVDTKARELGLGGAPGAMVHVLPVKAGFVGADCLAAVLAAGLPTAERPALLIDIGTNGEIVLGNKERLLCASCATGPVFEGAHIASGMRASHGAIEHVRIDSGTLEVELGIIGGKDVSPRGICGSGIISATSELLKAGVVDKKGMFKREFEGKFVLSGEIAVTQADIKAVQLAKAALYSGCRILLNRYGLEAPERVLLAGAFGSCVDRAAALRIGMFPECGLEGVKAVGNAAGDGARMALLDVKKREEVGAIAERMEYVELTIEPEFQNEFVRAIPFSERP